MRAVTALALCLGMGRSVMATPEVEEPRALARTLARRLVESNFQASLILTGHSGEPAHLHFYRGALGTAVRLQLPAGTERVILSGANSAVRLSASKGGVVRVESSAPSARFYKKASDSLAIAAAHGGDVGGWKAPPTLEWVAGFDMRIEPGAEDWSAVDVRIGLDAEERMPWYLGQLAGAAPECVTLSHGEVEFVSDALSACRVDLATGFPTYIKMAASGHPGAEQGTLEVKQQAPVLSQDAWSELFELHDAPPKGDDARTWGASARKRCLVEYFKRGQPVFSSGAGQMRPTLYHFDVLGERLTEALYLGAWATAVHGEDRVRIRSRLEVQRAALARRGMKPPDSERELQAWIGANVELEIPQYVGEMEAELQLIEEAFIAGEPALDQARLRVVRTLLASMRAASPIVGERYVRMRWIEAEEGA